MAQRVVFVTEVDEDDEGPVLEGIFVAPFGPRCAFHWSAGHVLGTDIRRMATLRRSVAVDAAALAIPRPFFLAITNGRTPSVHAVRVALCFRTWDQFPDFQVMAAWHERVLGTWRTPNELWDKVAAAASTVSPAAGDVLPTVVSVEGADHLGVLELLAEEGDGVFTARVHLCDGLPDLPAGTCLRRTVRWHDNGVTEQREAEIAVVLAAPAGDG